MPPTKATSRPSAAGTGRSSPPAAGWSTAPTTARLVLADGTVIEGMGLGATGKAVLDYGCGHGDDLRYLRDSGYEAFGWDLPRFVHTPLLRNADRSKLSKRKNHTSLEWFRAQGFLPEAMLNFLGTLGWSHPEEKDFLGYL